MTTDRILDEPNSLVAWFSFWLNDSVTLSLRDCFIDDVKLLLDVSNKP